MTNTERVKLEHTLEGIKDAIGYMERRMERAEVKRVTDTVLLRLCNAVKLLLESRIREVSFFTVCDQILTPPPRTEEEEAQRQQLIAKYYNNKAQRFREMGYYMPDFSTADPPLKAEVTRVLMAAGAAVDEKEKESSQ